MARYEKIKETIENMGVDDIVVLHNNYCEDCNYMDDYIYSMEDLDELLNGHTPLEVLDAVAADFNSNDTYIQGGVYGFKSFSYDTEGFIYPSDIAHYIDENETDLDSDEIADILNDYED